MMMLRGDDVRHTVVLLYILHTHFFCPIVVVVSM